MRRSGTGSGGGLGMNKNVRPGYKAGTPNRVVRPGGAGAIGAAWGTHVSGTEGGGMELPYRGQKVFGDPAIPSTLGNELTKPNGPKGQGRTLYGQSGSQSTYGKPNPGKSPERRDILSQFGSDKPSYRR